MMERFVDREGLKVSEPLAQFLEERALPGTGLAVDQFWQGTAKLFATLAPQNKALLEKRDRLQAEIDAWHEARRGRPHDPKVYQDFLREIGYLAPEPQPFKIGVTQVDAELAVI